MNTTPDINDTALPVKKKKSRLWLILLLLIMILAACAGTAYYFYQKKLPEETVEAFLNDMKNMNFDGMASHLQSSDLSALDNADIRNEAYEPFFRQINEKLSYEITKNSFDFQNGTAKITVLIRYIDGTDIYQEAISEFLRQIVSAAFSGENVDDAQKEAQERLASILSEKASVVEDKFTETELTYPLIRENRVWKIVALNEDTVKIMSANFKNAAEEVHKTLNTTAEEVSDSEPEESPSAPQAGDSSKTSVPAGETADGLILDTADFSIRYTDHKVEKDFAGKPCLLIYYDYTNTSSAPSSAMVDVSLQAWQDGAALSPAIPEKNNDASDRFFDEVKPGETINICQVFSLEGTGDVTVEAETVSETDTAKASQILKIK
ncbi:MAG: DUF5067 domain-containing protein [Blautia sp.]|nr:DUF5067 domain-containing protein [Eubacteriales bacterium]MED9965541.1 DUF5067 domain-containing protein [Blautia sp.]